MSSKQQANVPANKKRQAPIPPDIYPVIDNDLARDNLENDIPAADLEDLKDSSP